MTITEIQNVETVAAIFELAFILLWGIAMLAPIFKTRKPR